MARKKKSFPEYKEIEIMDAGAEGKAVARIDDMVVFVPYAAPGDIVDIRIKKKKKAYLEGSIIKFHKYSENRQEAFCKHFGLCGGCKWQHLDYKAQLFYKQKQVKDTFTLQTNLDQVIRTHMIQMLQMTDGKINGPDGAALLLGLNPSTLRHRLRKLGIPFGKTS